MLADTIEAGAFVLHAWDGVVCLDHPVWKDFIPFESGPSMPA